MFKVTLQLSRYTDLYHGSKVLTGIWALHEQGVVQVRCLAERRYYRHGGLLALDVERDGVLRHIAIDLHDRSDLFDPTILASCDVYFKRSCHRPDLMSLPVSLVRKVAPFGMNFPCRGISIAHRLIGCLPALYAPLMWQCVLGQPTELLKRARKLRQFLAAPHPRAIEVSPAEPLEPVIVFQPRVWEPAHVVPDDARQINGLRVRIVQALRRAFGKTFIGGLVPTPLALRDYPDLVTDQKTRTRAYIDLSRRALIGISTRGLNYSTPFKLSEYLAGSKVIVSERVRNETPVPLEDGKHLLTFEDPEQCVDQCAMLLRDRERAQSMRDAAHEYYRLEVEPAAHLARLFDRAFKEGNDTV